VFCRSLASVYRLLIFLCGTPRARSESARISHKPFWLAWAATVGRAVNSLPKARSKYRLPSFYIGGKNSPETPSLRAMWGARLTSTKTLYRLFNGSASVQTINPLFNCCSRCRCESWFGFILGSQIALTKTLYPLFNSAVGSRRHGLVSPTEPASLRTSCSSRPLRG